MSKLSRRQFLKSLGAIATFFVADRTGFSFAQKAKDFEMLVVGDSLIWGQGLEEKDKFYTLTKNWLQTEFNKQVNLKVKAHSGATIFLHEKESELLKKAEKPETEEFYPEVNVVFPTLETQIKIAKSEYEKEGKKAEEVDLIMLTGGIVDITVAGVLHPLGDEKKLKKQIIQYCNEDMFRFLDQSAKVFPNALFVVVGYFPIFSPKSDTAKAFNSVLEAFAFPRPLKLFANNVLIRPFFRIVKKKAINRSRVWFEDSNRELQTAVNRLNEKTGKQRAVFVKSPFTEDEALETPNSLLFRMKEKGRINDYLYNERLIECKKVLGNLRKSTGIKQSIRQCEIAAIGHPTPEGSKVYAQAIESVLKKTLLKIS
jgi:lysophospholipase L1-like esterase